ncbi:purine-nucleoside phosphorylase [Camelliibacillus cellulosilyticus]|uniref:Purine nucleoside phosphorylase n=1 Tax=Camelliibacillus cellulosilyticus TaxID=2174486 RepID=A0ABV9GKT7_9BACL
MTLLQRVDEAVHAIHAKTKMVPDLGLILGSGLGDLANDIQEPTIIDYKDIPHFPESTVAGHAGRLVIGDLEGKKVVAMQGRFHYYEGYDMQEVTFPVRVMRRLGAAALVVTNACGGMNSQFKPGDLMIITDHLNMTGQNPLIGPNDEVFGPRFPDMSAAYSKALIACAEKTAEEEGIAVQKGVYAAITGPSYMTPAELIMLRNLGADALGMSTVPEVIVANHMGMKVLGIACVTDMAIGEELEALTHEQVMAVAERTKPRFMRLMKETIRKING